MSQSSGEDGWWQFLELCQHIENKEDLDAFFNLFLTHEERNAIAGRYLIVQGLIQGQKTQRELAEELNVSIAKITRGSNFMKTIGEKLRKFLIKHMK